MIEKREIFRLTHDPFTQLCEHFRPQTLQSLHYGTDIIFWCILKSVKLYRIAEMEMCVLSVHKKRFFQSSKLIFNKV